MSAPAGRETARFTHSLSQSSLSAGVTHSVERGGLRAEYPVQTAIGSGNHAIGFLVRQAGELFQSPAAYYPRRKLWATAPGFDTLERPDFNRRVTVECLLCHSSGTGLAAITCERCHGSTTEHLRRPSKGNIVNPAALGRSERDSVCEQCHLAGEARILNPGATFGDFGPGKRTEETYSVYVFDRPRGDLRVVSHVEQLALSQCVMLNEKLWCSSCHDPHGGKMNINSRCQSCHTTGEHVLSRADCAGCHMPKRPAVDGSHTAFTDHRIARPGAKFQEIRPPDRLRAWREPGSAALAKRNLGLAYIMTGERDGSAEQINRGYILLAGVFPEFGNDADTLASLGMVLFLKDQFGDAARLLAEGIKHRPNDPALHEKLGVIRKADGDIRGAAQALENAIAADPLRETAYHLLADLQLDAPAKRAVLQRHLKVMPQSLITREALASLPRR